MLAASALQEGTSTNFSPWHAVPVSLSSRNHRAQWGPASERPSQATYGTLELPTLQWPALVQPQCGTATHFMEGPLVLDAALALASAHGDVGQVLALLSLGADPSALVEGLTALHYAAPGQSLPVYEALLHAGADANATGATANTAGAGGISPLQMACRHNCSAAILAALLAAGAQLEATDELGRTALDHAVEVGSTGAALELLRRGPQVPLGLLHEVACRADLDVLRALLLWHKADVEAADSTGLPPIFAAAATGSVEAVQLLVEHRADATRAAEGSNALLFGLSDSLDVVTRAHAAGREPPPKDFAGVARPVPQAVCFPGVCSRADAFVSSPRGAAGVLSTGCACAHGCCACTLLHVLPCKQRGGWRAPLQLTCLPSRFLCCRR